MPKAILEHSMSQRALAYLPFHLRLTSSGAKLALWINDSGVIVKPRVLLWIGIRL